MPLLNRLMPLTKGQLNTFSQIFPYFFGKRHFLAMDAMWISARLASMRRQISGGRVSRRGAARLLLAKLEQMGFQNGAYKNQDSYRKSKKIWEKSGFGVWGGVWGAIFTLNFKL